MNTDQRDRDNDHDTTANNEYPNSAGQNQSPGQDQQDPQSGAQPNDQDADNDGTTRDVPSSSTVSTLVEKACLYPHMTGYVRLTDKRLNMDPFGGKRTAALSMKRESNMWPYPGYWPQKYLNFKARHLDLPQGFYLCHQLDSEGKPICANCTMNPNWSFNPKTKEEIAAEKRAKIIADIVAAARAAKNPSKKRLKSHKCNPGDLDEYCNTEDGKNDFASDDMGNDEPAPDVSAPDDDDEPPPLPEKGKKKAAADKKNDKKGPAEDPKHAAKKSVDKSSGGPGKAAPMVKTDKKPPEPASQKPKKGLNKSNMNNSNQGEHSLAAATKWKYHIHGGNKNSNQVKEVYSLPVVETYDQLNCYLSKEQFNPYYSMKNSLSETDLELDDPFDEYFQEHMNQHSFYNKQKCEMEQLRLQTSNSKCSSPLPSIPASSGDIRSNKKVAFCPLCEIISYRKDLATESVPNIQVEKLTSEKMFFSDPGVMSHLKPCKHLELDADNDCGNQDGTRVNLQNPGHSVTCTKKASLNTFKSSRNQPSKSNSGLNQLYDLYPSPSAGKIIPDFLKEYAEEQEELRKRRKLFIYKGQVWTSPPPMPLKPILKNSNVQQTQHSKTCRYQNLHPPAADKGQFEQKIKHAEKHFTIDEAAQPLFVRGFKTQIPNHFKTNHKIRHS